MKETFTRPQPALQSINEEQQTDNNQDDPWINPTTNNNATTYQSAFQNYTRRSISSFDITNPKTDQQIETIKLDENHQQRPRSALLTKTSKVQTPLKRPVSKHHVDSLQINDNDNDDDNQDHIEQPKETILPPIKGSNETDNAKSRKIRELQNKLSRQEEEAKKQLNELQSKQSRLENALKLLVKQTSAYGKRRSQTQDDSDVSNDHHHQGPSPGKRKTLSLPLTNQCFSVFRKSTNTIIDWYLETRCINDSSSSRNLIQI